MIEFCVMTDLKTIKNVPRKYPELLEYEVSFRILIDEELFFEEPDFPLFEFLYAVEDWKQKECCSFQYTSIETEDNPLVRFTYEEDGLFTVFSTWQLFECETKFTKEQLVNAVDALEKRIQK